MTRTSFCPGDLCGHGHKPITYLSVGICICNPGYTGQCCEKDIDECISSRCIHGSTCIDGVNGYTCHCLSGYTGKYCQTDIDECSSSRCIHGSTCIDGVNGYTCHCLSGYTGKYCQTDIDECSSNPCQNYGICTERINGYTCRCPPGYTGQNCETNINECESNPCQHGGTCTDHLTLYTCTCAAGYFGKNCQINRQCHSNPCVNCGTCNDDQINGYTCKCHVGYTGHNCETVSPVTTVPEVILAPEKTINEGSGKEIIPCFANGIPDPIITWEALDGSLPSNAKQVTHYLYFENVTLLDEGHYMCTAKSMTGMDVKVIHIIVKAKPGKQHVAPLVTAPAIINVKYYTQTSLICNVTGYPTPSVIWKHYNKVIQSSGSTLVIPSVTNTTSGYYTCIATNDAGVSQANIQLIYTYDAPQIVSPPTSFVIAAGQSHNFTCVATGHPKPTIKWKFNSFVGHGTNLPPHVTTQNGSLLSLVRMQESGTLTCTARNEFGVDSSTVHVIVKHGSPAVG